MNKKDILFHKATLLIKDLDSKYGLTDKEIEAISNIVAEAIEVGKNYEKNEKF